jgi:hypothetical protein
MLIHHFHYIGIIRLYAEVIAYHLFLQKNTCITQVISGITMFWQVSAKPSGPEKKHTAILVFVLA